MSEEKSSKVRGKTFTVPPADSNIRKLFKEMFPKCTYYTDLLDAKIELVMVEPVISKTCVARVVRSSRELKFFSEFDYIIEFSKDIMDAVDENVQKLVILHELEHMIAIEKKDGTKQYALIDHDVKDFYRIVHEYGIDWFRMLKVQSARINSKEGKEPLDPDEVKIKL